MSLFQKSTWGRVSRLEPRWIFCFTMQDAVYIMELMIMSRPDKAPDDLGYLVSRAFAQELVDSSWNLLAVEKLVVKSGDDFQWKGFKCRVA